MSKINYASKFSAKVDERFKLGSITKAATNSDLNFDGADTVKVYSIPTVPMNNYKRYGDNRYGDAHELGDFVQTMTLRKDRSFTFTIDKASQQDQVGVKAAGAALRREIDMEIVPEVDRYTLEQISLKAGHKGALAITKTNAYECFLKASTEITNSRAPRGGRIAFVTPEFYMYIRLDRNFLFPTDIGLKTLINGQVGQIDSIKIIQAPGDLLPAQVPFMITHPIAAPSIMKLTEYNVNTNPEKISGSLITGRVRYDTFVFDEKTNVIYVHYNRPASDLLNAPTVTFESNSITMATPGETGAAIKYTRDGSDPRNGNDVLTYSSAISTASWDKGFYRIRACAVKEGKIDSTVTDLRITVT